MDISFGDFMMQNLTEFWHLTGFYNATFKHFVMLGSITFEVPSALSFQESPPKAELLSAM